MANWVRLWEDMPNDPKWRVIAKRSGCPIAEVIAVFVHMMANAGANATERGVLENWSDEDVAAALDMDLQNVVSIRGAMQDKTLDGDRLKGWEKRQPKREDSSAERAKSWRERNRTQPNAQKRPDTDTDTDAEKKDLRAARAAPRKGTRLPDDWKPTDDDLKAADEFLGDFALADTEAAKFRDYWISKPGSGGVKLDWSATWRNWCRKAAENKPRAGPARQRHETPAEIGNRMLRELSDEQAGSDSGDHANLVRLPVGGFR